MTYGYMRPAGGLGAGLASAGVAFEQVDKSTLSIKDAAAARGLKFGIAYKPDNPSDTTPYRNLVLAEASMLIPEVAGQSSVWCTANSVYDWSRFDQFVNIAKAAGLPWRVPSGFIYPAHDMSWVSTESGGVITAVNDGSGFPAVRAATWQAIIDNLIAAFKARCISLNSFPAQINAANELIDHLQADGWRRHPWYNATSGSGWLVYLIQQLKLAFPGTPIGLCQDILEQAQTFTGGPGRRAAFLLKLDELTAAGAKPDYVDLQCHLRDDRGWNAAELRTFLTAIKSRNIKIVIGEMDVRAATAANYTSTAYDAMVRHYVGQLLDVIVPFLDGGLIGVWGLGDTYNAWGGTERPLLYDTSLAQKPKYYAAVRNALAWR